MRLVKGQRTAARQLTGGAADHGSGGIQGKFESSGFSDWFID
jgi:hypothetical protein